MANSPSRIHQFREIGRAARRKEDYRLLTGKGAFTDDFSAPGEMFAIMVRSPYPHARISRIDKRDALCVEGVELIFTGIDCINAGMSGIPHNPIPRTKNDLRLRGPDDTEIFIGPHMPLPTDKVRHVGEAVAMIVADTLQHAKDAAEILDIEYEELPWITNTAAAVEINSPLIWDECQENTPVDTVFGDSSATDAVFIEAPHIVKMDFHIDRVTGFPLEPRSALAVPDRKTGGITLYAGSGGAVR